MRQTAQAWAASAETTQVDSFPEERTHVTSLRVVKGARGNATPIEPEDYVLDHEDERRTSLMNEILGEQELLAKEQERRIAAQIAQNRTALFARMKQLSNDTDKRFKEHGEGIKTLKRRVDEQQSFLTRGIENLASVERHQTHAGAKIVALEATVADLKGQLHDVRARQYTAGLAPSTNTAAPKQQTSRKMFSDFHLFVIATVLILSGVAAFVAQHLNNF